MDIVTDGLAPECERFVGEFLQFIPIEGWGWTGTAPAGPPPFRALLKELRKFRGTVKGGLAVIQEPEHRFDGYWLEFFTRHPGIYNFHMLGVYTITISPHYLEQSPDNPPMPPLKPPYFCGFTNILTLEDYEKHKTEIEKLK